MNFISPNLNQDYFFKFLSYINSSDLQAKLLPVRITFIVTSLIFLILIIFLLLKTSYLRIRFFGSFEKWDEFLENRYYNLMANRKRWNAIIDKFNSGSDLGVKLSLIEADKYLKRFITRKFVLSGKNFEEQLSNLTPDKIPNIEEVRKAHDISQKLITSPQFSLRKEEAKKLLAIFKKTFQHLGVI